VKLLSIDEVIELHRRIITQSGGSDGLRDRASLESCLAQPHQTFGGTDLYGTVWEKAAVLGFLLVCNHPFVDGNKRIGHAALEVMLVLNGLELEASVDEQERIVLALASGGLSREEFTDWVSNHVRDRS
jgi:death-on-curing protein